MKDNGDSDYLSTRCGLGFLPFWDKGKLALSTVLNFISICFIVGGVLASHFGYLRDTMIGLVLLALGVLFFGVGLVRFFVEVTEEDR